MSPNGLSNTTKQKRVIEEAQRCKIQEIQRDTETLRDRDAEMNNKAQINSDRDTEVCHRKTETHLHAFLFISTRKMKSSLGGA